MYIPQDTTTSTSYSQKTNNQNPSTPKPSWANLVKTNLSKTTTIPSTPKATTVVISNVKESKVTQVVKESQLMPRTKSKPNVELNKNLGNFTKSEDLLEFCSENIHQFDAINLSTALNMISKIYMKANGNIKESIIKSSTYKKLVLAGVDKIEGFNSRQLATTSRALSIINAATVHEEKLIDSIISEAKKKVSTFQPQGISNLTTALAKLGKADRALLSLFAKAMLETKEDAQPQNIANFLWACASCGYKNSGFLSEIEVYLLKKSDVLGARDIADIVWVFATLNYNSKACLDRLANRLTELVDQLNYLDISNILWGFASLGFVNENFLNSIQNELIKRFSDPHPEICARQIATIAWALGILNRNDDQLLEKLCTIAKKKLKEFNGQDISNFMKAMATFNYYDAQLIEGLAFEAKKKVSSFTTQGLSNTVWAFSVLRHCDHQLLEIFAKEALRKLDDFWLRDISNLAWSFSAVNHTNDKLFKCLAEKVKAQIVQFDAQSVANLAYSFAIVGYEDKQLFESLFLQAHQLHFLLNSFNQVELKQMLQVYYYLNLYQPEVDFSRCEYFINLLKALQPNKTEASSRTHLDVSKTLKGIKEGFENEFYSSGYVLDIAYPKENIAIEVEGEDFHLLKNHNHYVGKTTLKYAVLKKAGWKIIHIPCHEWDKQTNPTKKTHYLKHKLSELN